MKDYRKMSFHEFIDKEGVKNLSRRLKINSKTVRYWKDGHCYPRVHQMIAIQKMTKGGITYAKIIDGILSQIATR